MKFKKQWITALTISALTVGGASALAATNDSDASKTKSERHHFEGMKKMDVTILLDKLGITEDEAQTAREAKTSIAELAEEKGISFADYKKAVIASQSEQLDQFVKDGKMTEKQATSIKERMTEEFSDMTSYDELPDREKQGQGKRDGGPRDVFGDTTATILASLKLDEAKFEAADQALPEFAEANDIAFDDFEQAVLTAQTAAIDAKLADGSITEKQATSMKERMQERADQVSSYDDLKQGPRDGGQGGRHRGMNEKNTDQPTDPNASETSVDLAI